MNGFKESSWFEGGEASQQEDSAFGVCPTGSPSSHPNTSIPQQQLKLLAFKGHPKLKCPPHAEKISYRILGQLFCYHLVWHKVRARGNYK